MQAHGTSGLLDDEDVFGGERASCRPLKKRLTYRKTYFCSLDCTYRLALRLSKLWSVAYNLLSQMVM